jgi:hypothetical protein
MGIVFGFALEKSRVFEPGIIVGQMQLRNFITLLGRRAGVGGRDRRDSGSTRSVVALARRNGQ